MTTAQLTQNEIYKIKISVDIADKLNKLHLQCLNDATLLINQVSIITGVALELEKKVSVEKTTEILNQFNQGKFTPAEIAINFDLSLLTVETIINYFTRGTYAN
ncbi:hypothetical protein HY745_13410 [Candidatus Desantisbacteria bacterium]|nr:hypothetical protein [Candidatus Desantisbacteria bacterium]